MFLHISRDNNDNFSVPKAEAILIAHPGDLAFMLDRAWNSRVDAPRYFSPTESIPLFREGVSETRPSPLNEQMDDPGAAETFHLIYAYMIENTRVYEIFQRVLKGFLHSEDLGFPSEETQMWLRATEELFYRETPPWLIQSLTSDIRPDQRSSRRNAYYRMFGLDLNHGSGGTVRYPYIKPTGANTDFVIMFEQLLRETWKGMMNLRNFGGPNETDDAKIVDLVNRLQSMLLLRRQHGNLAREEFFYTAMMQWFHVTVSFDSSVVRDLRADAENEYDRLKMIADRVGFPAHPQSYSFFRIAEPLSLTLSHIESFDPAIDHPQDFYRNGVIRTNMETIITHWSIATGRNIKARDVNPMPVGAR
jgi:hypothetical protein